MVPKRFPKGGGIIPSVVSIPESNLNLLGAFVKTALVIVTDFDETFGDNVTL